MKLIIGNQNYSSWSLRPWVLMHYFNLDFEVHKISLFKDDMLEKMSAFCPNNKVPVLIDNNHKIWDSLAICEYINEQYLKGRALPQTVTERAIARAICAEMHSSFLAIRNEMPMNCRRIPSKITYSQDCQKDIDRIIALWQECLSNQAGRFLFGDFSMADAFYLPIASRFHVYQIKVPHVIQQYIEALLTLPSYQLWLKTAKLEEETISVAEI